MADVLHFHFGQALELLKLRSFDALLVDLNMPGINGMKLVKAVWQLYPHAIILSLILII